jgi:hypothetical protein
MNIMHGRICECFFFTHVVFLCYFRRINTEIRKQKKARKRSLNFEIIYLHF